MLHRPSTYVAYMLWNWAIARRGAATASTFGLLVPILSGVLSVLFFGEQFGLAKLFGAACVLAGLVIVRLPARPAHRADAEDAATSHQSI
jgi:drug/metabolite transporter (DMT)-like permease